MKTILLLTILLGSQFALGATYEQKLQRNRAKYSKKLPYVPTTNLYLLQGKEKIETATGNEERDVQTYGVTFRIQAGWHLGGYWSNVHSYGWLVEKNLAKNLRLMMIVGKSRKTVPSNTNNYYYNKRSYQLGLGLTANLTKNLGVTGTISQANSGGSGRNKMMNIGLSLSF